MKTTRTNSRKKIQTDECVRSVLNWDECEEGRIQKCQMNYDAKEMGLFDGDVILYDSLIEPAVGQPAIYSRKRKGKRHLTVMRYTREKQPGWKYEGMITHFSRCVYESAYDILSAEFVTDIEEKEIR